MAPALSSLECDGLSCVQCLLRGCSFAHFRDREYCSDKEEALRGNGIFLGPTFPISTCPPALSTTTASARFGEEVSNYALQMAILLALGIIGAITSICFLIIQCTVRRVKRKLNLLDRETRDIQNSLASLNSQIINSTTATTTNNLQSGIGRPSSSSSYGGTGGGINNHPHHHHQPLSGGQQQQQPNNNVEAGGGGVHGHSSHSAEATSSAASLPVLSFHGPASSPIQRGGGPGLLNSNYRGPWANVSRALLLDDTIENALDSPLSSTLLEEPEGPPPIPPRPSLSASLAPPAAVRTTAATTRIPRPSTHGMALRGQKGKGLAPKPPSTTLPSPPE